MRKVYISLAFKDNNLTDYVGDTNKQQALSWCKMKAEQGYFVKMKCMERGLFGCYWYKYETTSPF